MIYVSIYQIHHYHHHHHYYYLCKLFYTFKKFGVIPLYKPGSPSFLRISLKTLIIVLGYLSDIALACNRVLTSANGYEHT